MMGAGLSTLTTAAKTIIPAINELRTNLGGALTNLTTGVKTSLVDAINWLNSNKLSVPTTSVAANTHILIAPATGNTTPTLFPLSEVGGIKVQGTAPPGNANQLWIPTTGALSGVPHYWNGTAWVPTNTVWG